MAGPNVATIFVRRLNIPLDDANHATHRPGPQHAGTPDEWEHEARVEHAVGSGAKFGNPGKRGHEHNPAGRAGAGDAVVGEHEAEDSDAERRRQDRKRVRPRVHGRREQGCEYGASGCAGIALRTPRVNVEPKSGRNNHSAVSGTQYSCGSCSARAAPTRGLRRARAGSRGGTRAGARRRPPRSVDHGSAAGSTVKPDADACKIVFDGNVVLSQSRPISARNLSSVEAKTSLSSPATMWPARRDVDDLRHGGCGCRMSARPASLTTSDWRPRTISVGTVDRARRPRAGAPGRCRAAARRRSAMNAGSQCQYQRPSSCRRTFLRSPSRLRGPRAVRVVGGDRVGDLLERGEAVGVRGHEVADAVDARAARPWTTTSTSTSAAGEAGVFAGGGQRGDPAQRCADEHRRPVERRRRTRRGRRRRRRRVVVRRDAQSLSPWPRASSAIAVRPSLGQRAARCAPRVARLSAAVQQHHRRAVAAGVPTLAGERDAVGFEVQDSRFDCLCHSRLPSSPGRACDLIYPRCGVALRSTAVVRLSQSSP